MAVLLGCAPASAKIAHLLPKPQQVTPAAGGAFSLNRAVRITDPTSCVPLAELFTSVGRGVTDDASAPTVTVELVSSIPGAYDYTLEGFPNEAYELDVSADAVSIKAVTATGVIRAAQTLAQLAEGYGDAAPELEACSVRDWPAFKLRGYMHDVGRSFISFNELKHQIDLLARFKVNVFQWHMTDNQGWRFEVKAYPQLTAASSMTRFAGSYYTQAQCTELEAYAKERGVTIIPEIDMPGHSEAFQRAMGHSMQTASGVAELQAILEEVADVFPNAPYIHIGADEQEITYPNFLKIMTDKVHSLGRKCVVWNPIVGVTITASTGADMTQMWSTRGNVVSGLPNIDCRYNYTNHFDVFADLVGIYKSNIYYAQRGSANIAGEISAYWNDRKTPTEKDIIRQNNFYANVLASTERAWIGGGKQYIETGGTTLPNSGDEYDEFANWEERFLFHKANSLQNEPIPYVRQSNVRWIITDAFPNGGDATLQFPPETEGEKDSYTYNGNTYGTARATGAGIYLRHTWGTTVPAFYANPQLNSTAYAWTYVYSPEARSAGALIEFQNYGRSEKDTAPDNGKWDRKGSRIWLNGTELLPGTAWTNAGRSITNEVDLANENFTARTPVKVQLNEGWNKVFLKLPYVDASGVRLNKWMFTFVLTDEEGKNALDGLVYSPTQSLDEGVDAVISKISELRSLERAVCKDQPGYYPPSTADAMEAVIAEIEATLGDASVTPEQRQEQVERLEAAMAAFRSAYESAGIVQPKASTDTEEHWYKMWTPNRGNRHASVSGTQESGSYYLTGAASPTNASYWKFVERADGTWDIVSRSNGQRIYPEIVSNSRPMLKVAEGTPSAGWTLKPAETLGMVIFTSGTVEFNQTNGATTIGWNGGSATVPSYCIINWGSGTNVTDDG
ncbi:MAG: family 20 glycosylhydrolase, partial [Alloprevotella sp.]|nr:family 20 glycosylhydrolase [Alloprevotella sp.]